MKRYLLSMLTVMLASAAFAQAPSGRPPRPVFWVTTTAWLDGTTREDLMKAMDGHIVGKAAWFGRFHAPSQ